MYNKILNKEEKIAVIGLGYVGLPIALEFAKKAKVVGFDIKEDRVEMMKNKIDPSDELPPEAFDNCDIRFTADVKDIQDSKFYIIYIIEFGTHNTLFVSLKKILKKIFCNFF